MGRVRTKTVKKSARQIIEKYYSKLTLDFQTNKKVCDEIAILPSKRMRNKISGYITKLMKRIQRGPVRGISLKLQEEERERRMDFIPEVSALHKDKIHIDSDTKEMLQSLNIHIPNASTDRADRYGNRGFRKGGRSGKGAGAKRTNKDGGKRQAKAPRQQKPAAAAAPAPAAAQ